MALVIMKHPRWNWGSSMSTGGSGMGSQGRALMLDLGLHLHLSSPVLFLEWDSRLGERKELWEAIPGSPVGLEILLQALEFYFPVWPGTCPPLPQPTTYSSRMHPLPPPLESVSSSVKVEVALDRI